MSAKLAIIIEGGIIQNVISSEPVEVVVVDRDDSAVDESDCKELEGAGGQSFKAYAYAYEGVEIDQSSNLFNQVKEG